MISFQGFSVSWLKKAQKQFDDLENQVKEKISFSGRGCMKMFRVLSSVFLCFQLHGMDSVAQIQLEKAKQNYFSACSYCSAMYPYPGGSLLSLGSDDCRQVARFQYEARIRAIHRSYQDRLHEKLNSILGTF